MTVHVGLLTDLRTGMRIQILKVFSQPVFIQLTIQFSHHSFN